MHFLGVVDGAPDHGGEVFEFEDRNLVFLQTYPFKDSGTLLEPPGNHEEHLYRGQRSGEL